MSKPMIRVDYDGMTRSYVKPWERLEMLGDQPLEPKYAVKMEAAARALDILLNGENRGQKRETGFVLLVFPFGGDGEMRCNYISNGADRRDVPALLREQAARFEAQLEKPSRT